MSIAASEDSRVNGNGQPKEWHDQEEVILKSWGETSQSQKYMHNRAYKRMVRMHMMFSLPVIVISTIAGTANFATGAVPEEYREYVSLVTGGLNLFAGIITTVSQFLKIPERLEGHRATSLDYGKLHRNISVELQLPVRDRSHDGRKFVDDCRKEIERLQNSAPDIPISIVRAFGRRFRKADFRKPDILQLFPIHIYREPESPEEKRIKQLVEHETVRAQAAQDFKRSVEETAKRMQKARHKIRKKSVNASAVTSSMSRLISSIGARTQAADAVLEGLREKESASSAFEFTPSSAVGVTTQTTSSVLSALQDDDGDDSTPTLCSLSDGDDRNELLPESDNDDKHVDVVVVNDDDDGGSSHGAGDDA